MLNAGPRVYFGTIAWGFDVAAARATVRLSALFCSGGRPFTALHCQLQGFGL